jgi:hypothetical protein
MHHPAHIDGRTVVLIYRDGRHYKAFESGRLSYDGTALTLETNSGRRLFSDDEISQIKHVIAENRIAACHGFDFFLLTEKAGSSS